MNAAASDVLDLIPDIANTPVPTDAQVKFFVQAEATDMMKVTIKYDQGSKNKYGAVYVLGILPDDSPLLTGKSAGSDSGMKTMKMVRPLAGRTLVTVVLTRGGWKQASAVTPTEPLYEGNLTDQTQSYSLYRDNLLDRKNGEGVVCVGYAAPASATSAKGLVRPLVTAGNTERRTRLS